MSLPTGTPTDPRDVARAIILGLGLVGLGVGCLLVYPPAGLIVPCSILVAAALGLSLRR
jgi:uncharacterized protein (DUF302 family)